MLWTWRQFGDLRYLIGAFSDILLFADAYCALLLVFVMLCSPFIYLSTEGRICILPPGFDWLGCGRTDMIVNGSWIGINCLAICQCWLFIRGFWFSVFPWNGVTDIFVFIIYTSTVFITLPAPIMFIITAATNKIVVIAVVVGIIRVISEILAFRPTGVSAPLGVTFLEVPNILFRFEVRLHFGCPFTIL